MIGPLVVILVLSAGGVYGIVALVKAFQTLAREQEDLDGWPKKAVGSAVERTYRRVQELVARGEPVHSSELADQAVSEILEKRLAFPRFVAVGAVYAGLFGALIGLQQGLGALPKDPPSTIEKVKDFTSGVLNVAGDFGYAFASAIAGVLITLILNWTITALEQKGFAYGYALEDKIRGVMLDQAGVNKRIDPAFEALRELADSLSKTFQKIQPALDASVERIDITSRGLVEMINQSTESLRNMRTEFVTAKDGLAEALTSGAKAIQESSSQIAAELSTAAVSAGSEIAMSTRDASAAIRQEVENAKIAHNTLATGAEQMQLAVEQAVGQLELVKQTYSSSRDLFASIQATQQALTENAVAHRQFIHGVREDLSKVIAPVLEELKDQAASSRATSEEFIEALKSHENFVIELRQTVTAIPVRAADEVASRLTPQISEKVERSLGLVVHDVQRRLDLETDVAGLLSEVNHELKAIREAKGEPDTEFARRISELGAAVQTLQSQLQQLPSSQQLDSVQRDLFQLKKAVLQEKTKKRRWPWKKAPEGVE